MSERWLGIVALDASAWTVLSIGSGYAGHRVSDHWLRNDNVLTRLRSFEQHGEFWQRWLAVRRWKDRLPEAGSFFGGMSKRHLRRREDMQLLVIETRRAELVHWALMACAPAFALWNPPVLALAMVIFAVVANGPCIVIQRFNRQRLIRIVERASRVGR